MPINVTPLKITKASNNILPSSFKKFSSLTNLFGDLLGRAPSLDSVLGHSPNKSIIDGIITNNISGSKIPQIINGISSAINAGRFGMILHNFLKFISSKKYSDTGAIDSLTHREIFEMIEEGSIGKQNNKPSPSHDKPKKNIIKKNDDEEIKMEIFRIIRDLFEDEHPPMVNRYEQAGGDIFFVDISNTPNNLQQHLSSVFSTQLIFSKNIVDKVLLKLGYDDNEKCEYYKPIIIRCLIEYLSRQKVDIKNTDMDDILRIPWLYCPDKNLSNEIRKIDDLTSGKNKS
ncbi:hypothetical protein II654_02015 [bacterium]|nr:hypothetical protein [bacterium]